MNRVKPAAKSVGAKWYQAWSKKFPGRLMTDSELYAAKTRNARWLNSKIKEGYTIYDIGPRGKNITSPFYQLERDIQQLLYLDFNMKTHTLTLKMYYSFLFTQFNFETEEITANKYGLYAKFLSRTVRIYYIYEFRDSIPQIQFSLLSSNTLELRLGLYSIIELYKKKDYKLQSFYLDEILEFKGLEKYQSYFVNINTIEDGIIISSNIVKKCAEDFVIGCENSYHKIDIWYKSQILNI